VTAWVNLFDVYHIPAGRRTFGLRRLPAWVATNADRLRFADDALAQDGVVLAGLRPSPTSGRRATSPCGAPSLQTSDDR
jgi:hypothetical protein